MENELIAFKREIDSILDLLNDYLASIPELEHLQVDTLSLSPLENNMKIESDKNDFNLLKDIKTTTSIKEKEIIESIEGLGIVSAVFKCKICRNRKGQLYCYYGSGPCPVFH